MADGQDQLLTTVRNFQQYGVRNAARLMEDITKKAEALESLLASGAPDSNEVAAAVSSLSLSLESLQSAVRMVNHYYRQLWNIVNQGK